MLEDKQPIWDFLLRGREISEDSDPRTSTASKEMVEDWDKLGASTRRLSSWKHPLD